jgi:AcrR family transcriptional regulator
VNDRLSGRSTRRWSRRKQARPEEITRAALELFVERGFAATRLEDVAARAGVSKGTLYLYFANKEELFKAVVREGLVSPLAQMRQLAERHTGSAIELLRTLIEGWWARIGSTPLSGIPKLVIAEARNFPEIGRFYLEEVVEPGQRTIARIVERGIERGEFRRVDPREAALLVAAPMLMIALWRNSLGCCAPPDAGLDPRRLLELHLESLQRALAAPSPAGAGAP